MRNEFFPVKSPKAAQPDYYIGYKIKFVFLIHNLNMELSLDVNLGGRQKLGKVKIIRYC